MSSRGVNVSNMESTVHVGREDFDSLLALGLPLIMQLRGFCFLLPIYTEAEEAKKVASGLKYL